MLRDVSRIAVVVTHPIQYFTPLYRAIAADSRCKIKVFFASRQGVDLTPDAKMGVSMAWATDLLGGYDHEFLPEAAGVKRLTFWEINNPSIHAKLKGFAPETLIIHGYAGLTLWRALIWSKLNSVPAILISDSSTGANSGALKRYVKALIFPAILSLFSAFLTMGDRSEAYLADLGAPKSKFFRAPPLIDNGFWVARAQREAGRASVRHALGITGDEFVFLCVSKLYPGKRLDDVISAVEKASERIESGVNIRLLIVGDGVQRTWLEDYARAKGVNAIFTGFVNIDEIPSYYCAADILVHAAALEQYGMVMLEAAIAGLPMIVSDRVGAIGPTSIARPDVNALIFPCGDVDALAHCMVRLADNQSMREAFATASLEISTDHSGPKTVKAVISAVAKSRKARGAAPGRTA